MKCMWRATLKRRPAAIARLIAGALAAGISASGCSDALAPGERGALSSLPTAGAAILPGKGIQSAHDTYIRSDAANKNYGSNDSLRIRKVSTSGANRILITFDQGTIVDSIAGDSLVSATIELTIKRNGNDWGTAGRPVGAHRVTRAWAEDQATWTCPNDAVPSNNVADCTGTTWSMGASPNPFIATATGQAIVRNGQTGIVRFDVTADVRAFLAAQVADHGWLLKLANEGQTGTVVFHSAQGTAKPRLVLSIYQGAVPAQAPDSQPVWMHSDTNIVLGVTAALAGPFTKRIVVVQFLPGTTVASRASAVNAVGGQVVGGLRIPNGEGYYYLRIEDVLGTELLAKASQLRSMTQVASAFLDVGIAPQYRVPSDGPGWTKDTAWRLLPSQVDGAKPTWALTAINAPFAWGCSTGDSSLAVAAVDADFRVSPQAPQLFSDIRGYLRTATRPGSGGHGAIMAGIIGARGNNGTEMTGVLWNADLRLYDYNVQTPGVNGPKYFTSELAPRTYQAAVEGARIINISSGTDQLPSTITSMDSVYENQRLQYLWAFRGALQVAAARGFRPLVVLSAGNGGHDAFFNTLPRLRDSFQDQILTVTATSPAGDLWVDSDTGNYVDLAAPGARVFGFDTLGNISPIRDGTSSAAAFVTGVAGLLLSFDSRLTNAEVRQFIVDGARRGNRSVIAGSSTYYIADAYESLKLAARRPGAPLCGNRLWATADSLFAERGTGDEKLFVRENNPDGARNQNPIVTFHGGHDLDFGGLLKYQNGQWAPSAGPYPVDYWGAGSSHSAKGESHDGDLRVSFRYPPQPEGTVDMYIEVVALGTSRFVTRFDGFAAGNAAFPQVGSKFAVPIWQSPDNHSTDVWVYDSLTGAKQVLFTLPDGYSVFAAQSEDGTELSVSHSPWLGLTCTTEFRSMMDGHLLRAPITYSLLGSNPCASRRALVAPLRASTP